MAQEYEGLADKLKEAYWAESKAAAGSAFSPRPRAAAPFPTDQIYIAWFEGQQAFITGFPSSEQALEKVRELQAGNGVSAIRLLEVTKAWNTKWEVEEI